MSTVDGPACPVRVRALWLVKGGNAEAEYEDAFAADAGRGLVAVCDGAGEGIFCRDWATRLAADYVREAPDLDDAAAVAAWLAPLQQAWRAAIRYPELRYSQQAKVDRYGAAATLLVWRLTAVGAGEYAWRAWAVGDSCLFWVRDGRVLLTFPFGAPAEFQAAPALLSSQPARAVPGPLTAEGRCRPGDLFLLATDAIACRWLAEAEAGPPPDLGKLAATAEEVWRGEIESLRAAGAIVNDDCTAVVIEILAILAETGCERSPE